MSDRKPKSKETEKNAPKVLQTELSPFPIVGIGASAGGLEALEQFFGNMPIESGMAFVVIQHLDPNHAGIMPELLQRITPMKVFQATDRLKVKQNCVYVIPPNKSLSLLNGNLHLFDPVESRGLRLPVDFFFRSLADDQQHRSIGIILSGMGSDGSLGLKAIKEKNGIVLVQEPASAKFDGMPRSATEAVIADIIAPAMELPVRLISFLKYIPVAKPENNIDARITSNLDKIIILISDQTGQDFSMYKKNTLFRRIERRMGVHQIDKISTYVRFLQENKKEIDILFKELLIGVTNFFRDVAVWESLKENVLTALMDESPYNHVLRAWVTGCSTGEEAYTLAMVFKEVREKIKNHKNLSLQIFATDLDHDAIEIARRGFYSSNIAADVSPDRLNQFFTHEAEGYRVNASIREMVVFAPQNVIKDPPFTKIDILTCRNLLIYMQSDLQKKVIGLFHYSLNPGGVMVLGTSETIGTENEGFSEIDARSKIFRRSMTAAEKVLIDFPSSFARPKSVSATATRSPKVVDNIQTMADQFLLQRFTPASVLVNGDGEILYMTGRIDRYIVPVAGKANYNIHVMAREGLRQGLPGAMRKAMQSPDPVHLANVKIGTNGGTLFVDVTVQRVENPDSHVGVVMIIFTDVPARAEHSTLSPVKGKQGSTLRMKGLEGELQRCREDMQSTREEMQTSQEELKSTNEELQSTNEELQSTNEELTTSKEEMQSLNEELQTVNTELQCKISDFIRANDDMKNLLNSTEVATLFLDRELNVRRFTEQVTKIMKLRNTDIGRPFTDLVSDLQYPEIGNHVAQVIKTLVPVESAIPTADGRWFNVRIMPYRTLDDHIDGLVMTFADITLAKIAEKTLSISETRYRSIFESAKDGILILDEATGKIVDVNPFLITLLGYSKEQFLEKAIWEIGFLRDIVANKDVFSELQQKEIVRYENLPLETADGRKINVEFISNVYLVAGDKVIQCFIRESIVHPAS
ncbi:MAG: chemotaxis protein CheB [Bacteroidota bacterium]